MLFGGVEIGEQVENLVQHLDVPLVRLVDLVDRNDRAEADLERLRHHEFCLRHRAFGGVHQHDGAVHHVEYALHLAAKIGVARRVDDVDAGVLPLDGRNLRKDGYAALAFQIVRIHRAFGHALVLAERAGLFQEHVDERRLAMIDVGNNGDVAQRHVEPRLSESHVTMREFALDVRQRRVRVNGHRGFCAACAATRSVMSAIADARG